MSKIATISTTVSTTTGLWAWIGNNSGALSVVIAFVSLCVAIIFYCLNYLNASKKRREKIEKEIAQKISLAKSMGASIDDIIDNSGRLQIGAIRDRRRHCHKSMEY